MADEVCPLCDGTGWRVVERNGLSGATRCSCSEATRAATLMKVIHGPVPPFSSGGRARAFTTSDREASAETPAGLVFTARPGIRLVVVYSWTARGSARRAEANARSALRLIVERSLTTLPGIARPATVPASTAPRPRSCTKYAVRPVGAVSSPPVLFCHAFDMIEP